MQVDYTPFIDRVIDRYEGPYGWNRRDPGGPTKFGITCWDLAAHRGQKMDSMERWAPLVRAMPRSEAEDIYRVKYARHVHFSELPAGVDCCMLDYAINSGIYRPVRVANALFKLPVRHNVTTDLMKAIQGADPEWFIKAMDAERLHFMHLIRHGTAWAEFGHGWERRVDDLTAYSCHLANGAKHAAPVLPAQPVDVVPKATHVNPSPVKSITTAAGSSGVAGSVAHHFSLTTPEIIGAVALVAALGIGYIIYEQGSAARANAKVTLPAGVTPRPVK